ncbi:MAG: hypothetical protein HY565_02840 [Candidatus Kerfeldbacteria bacterium]|nr:hypothetical protein [Candidatus Kerfeldbacteria bacterium]
MLFDYSNGDENMQSPILHEKFAGVFACLPENIARSWLGWPEEEVIWVLNKMGTDWVDDDLLVGLGRLQPDCTNGLGADLIRQLQDHFSTSFTQLTDEVASELLRWPQKQLAFLMICWVENNWPSSEAHAIALLKDLQGRIEKDRGDPLGCLHGFQNIRDRWSR